MIKCFIKSPDNQASSNHSDEFLTHTQLNQYADYTENEGDVFLNQYTDIQYEDVTSLISSLEYLNINHMNV